jgi:hypothetical protein
MEQQVMDRRLEARFPVPDEGAARATLRPGCVVSLIDVSGGGALVEGPKPLRPGARVHLQVTTASRTFAIEAQVMRCAVWILDPFDGVRYRGALRFDRRIEWSWGTSSRVGSEVPVPAEPDRRHAGHAIPAAAGALPVDSRKSAKSGDSR